ncbi:MAG: T9SS type A sorting domain-containing protein [Ignavibacteriae bacterium]|nr:T9SS type A sorting domain-containing protein [Ignavibacteriota bacterium]
MKKFNRIFIFSTFMFLFYQTSSSQWQFCGNYTGNVLSFAVHDSVLIAGTNGSGVYYTTNGIDWNYSINGMTDLKIISMTLSGNIVFSGSETGGVYRSMDNGINWTPVNTGLTSFEIHTICSNAGIVYAGNNTGVFMTSDNGSNWTKISTSAVGSTIFAVTAYDNKVIATSASGAFITTNGGTNWNNITYGTAGYIYCLTSFNNAVYAGSSSQGVYKTTNDGLNWIHLNSGLPSGKAVRGIFCENEKIYAAVYNSGGIYFFISTGSSWFPANEGLTQLTCYNVILYKNYMYAGTTTGIFRRLKSEFVSITKIDKRIPGEYRLYNNYPNPFNPLTIIKFQIKEPGFVTLKVYDLLGKEITTLVNENQITGTYVVNWNASNYPSGVYFYRIQAGDFIKVMRMVLIK